jgi:hypothetical protein
MVWAKKHTLHGSLPFFKSGYVQFQMHTLLVSKKITITQKPQRSGEQLKQD